MNFYKLWEELSSELSTDDLYKIAQRIWGSCSTGHGPNKDTNQFWVNCDFENRELFFLYLPERKLLGISFGWAEEPETLSNKERNTFPTANKMQSGTLSGAHKFIEFTKIIKSHNISIKFITKGRRYPFYDKILKMAGYKQLATGYYT
jgi:hypothetical protein